MNIQVQYELRARKLGVLIRDARLNSRKTIQECAQMSGVTSGIFRSWEEGRRSPSLPELELLSYGLDLPLQRFWSKESIQNSSQAHEITNIPALINLRQRLVGAMLRQAREKANLTPQTLAELSGISSSRVKNYEMGVRPIPTPELEALIVLVGGKLDDLFDRTGPIGAWLSQQKVVNEFVQLPADLQLFITQPVNLPYIELARKLSGMSTEKLRSVAEGLLDITL
jgi:transcriptional regulator with XRE-family HTH domain